MAVPAELDYISSRQIGAATVTAISEGVLPWDLEMQVPESEWRREMPEADADGKVRLGLTVVHIRLGDASILIDPGFGDPLEERGSVITHWPGVIRSPGLSAALNSMGIAPEAITHVLISHVHDDHFEGTTVLRENRREPRYPQARVFLERKDWEQNPRRANPASAAVLHLGTLERLGRLEIVDGEVEILPGVTMIEAPGETPGHSVIRLQSDGHVLYYLGDLAHHPSEIVHPGWMPKQVAMSSILQATRERIYARVAGEGADVLLPHAQFPPWGRIVQTAGGFAWERLSI